MRTLIIACGAIAREITQIIGLGRSDLKITCLPPELHNYPDKITPAIREKIVAATSSFEKIFVAYGDCGTGGQLDTLLEEYGVERLEGAHCYEFFAGKHLFEEWVDEEPGTFFVTDYLLNNFERLIIRGLGIDRHPNLLDSYFGHYRRLIYLAQSPAEEQEELAAKYADYLGLSYEFRYSGLEPLARQMKIIARCG